MRSRNGQSGAAEDDRGPRKPDMDIKRMEQKIEFD